MKLVVMDNTGQVQIRRDVILELTRRVKERTGADVHQAVEESMAELYTELDLYAKSLEDK